jgi:hypothetical protein
VTAKLDLDPLVLLPGSALKPVRIHNICLKLICSWSYTVLVQYFRLNLESIAHEVIKSAIYSDLTEDQKADVKEAFR